MKRIDELIERYPDLAGIKGNIEHAYQMMEEAYTSGHKILIGGNGGSCADGEHMVGELMKGFLKHRVISAELQKSLQEVDPEMGAELSEKLEGAITAITVTNHPGLTTAYANDIGAEYEFAQQVNGYGRRGDLFIAISTSGNSKNVLFAAVTAKAMGIKVLAFTGGTGGKLMKYADEAIVIPYNTSFEVQERHMPVYHALCLEMEDKFF